MTDPATYYLVPAEGLRVRKPDGELLAGERVAHSTYWARRIADGDVQIGKEPKEPAR